MNPRYTGLRLLVLPAFLLAFARAATIVSVMPAPSTPVHEGQSVTMAVLNVPSTSYQWRHNGVDIPGATAATFTMIAGAADAGKYAVAIQQGATSSSVDLGAMTIAPTDAKLINLSARGMVGLGDNQMIMGFVSQGDASGSEQTVLLRGMGPSLRGMGGMMTGAIANPMLTVYDGAGCMMGSDMGWTHSPTVASGSGTSNVPATMRMATMGMMSSLGAFVPSGSNDSALMMTAPTGLYTTVIGGDGATGVALAECYDGNAVAGGVGHLVNMSARANVGVGENVLVGGFVIGAGASGDAATVLVRAMGPSLVHLGLLGTMAKPTMTLYDVNSKPIATATAWTEAPQPASGSTVSPVHAGIEPASLEVMNRVGAFAPMAGAADSAMIATLPPGNYSVVVSGAADSAGSPTTGIVLLEIYQVD